MIARQASLHGFTHYVSEIHFFQRRLRCMKYVCFVPIFLECLKFRNFCVEVLLWMRPVKYCKGKGSVTIYCLQQ